MKTYFKYILAPTALAFTLYGCSDLSTPGSDTDESIRATYEQGEARQAQIDAFNNNENCDFDDRRTVKMIKDEKGIVKLVARSSNPHDGYTLALHVPTTNQRFTACGLPSDMKVAGTVVIFSGEEKVIFPNEKWTATPFELTDITMIQAGDGGVAGNADAGSIGDL